MTMRLVLLLSILGVVAASAAAAGWPGPPRSPAPRLTQQGPPPAWVETRTKTRWMAFSSYCWSASGVTTRKAVCADMIPPQSRTDLPTLTVRRGEVVRIHLAYTPRGVHLTLYRAMSFRHYVLPPSRVLSWRAAGTGVAALDVRAAPGTASYLVRVSAR